MAPDVRRPVDRLLLLFASLLIMIGMLWIYSATALKTSDFSRTGTTFLVQQLVGGSIGLVLMLGLTQVDLAALRENRRPLVVLYVLALVFLASVFVFPARNGAHRWIVLAGKTIQPSEFFKPLAVLITAWWMVKHQAAWARKEDAIPKLVTLAGILLLPLALILKEPDFGTSFLIVAVCVLVVFLGGAPGWIFAIVLPVLGTLAFAFVRFSKYRWDRVQNFMNPESDPLGKGHQIIQSLVAVGNGGPIGMGLGAGRQKLFFLPEAHTDFIYAVIAEEAGLIGTTVVLLLFLGILWRGFRIARRVRDGYLKLCAAGFTLLLVLQALMNMSVVISIFPNKGIPLPFISYGGTSLMASMMVLGLLLAISKEASE